MKGRTTLIIAHRLSTISLADEVVVLDRGRIVARGRHDELVTESPVYRQIHQHGLVERRFIQLDPDGAPIEKDGGEPARRASSGRLP
jgi:ABC-type multidrug transport system ATPase subunit